jgi:hypothetical protein
MEPESCMKVHLSASGALECSFPDVVDVICWS